jgi:DNA topoisomerase-3
VRVRAGWQEVAGFATPDERRPDEETEGDEDKPQTLPALTVGMRLRAEFTVVAKKTRPPPRYTEASLLAAMDGAGKKLADETLRQAMKDHGLGTPATRAAIIETLLDRGYVVRQAKLLVPTELGLDLITTLPVPALCSPELTGQWEARLSRLARGEGSAADFMAAITASVRELVSAVQAAPAQSELRAAVARPATAKARPATAKKTRRSGVRRKAAGEARAGSEAGEKKTAPRRRATGKGKARARPLGDAVTPPAPSTRRRGRAERAATAPVVSEPPAPGTPVEPPLLCPLCRQARLLWGRRAWGCADFRRCSLVLPYEEGGRRRNVADLRAFCAARAVTVSEEAGSVASDRPSGRHS